jgi:hypothetical protein
MSNQSLVLHDIEKGRRREAEGKTYCLFGMVCAAICTDIWDWAVVEESPDLFDARSFHQPNSSE